MDDYNPNLLNLKLNIDVSIANSLRRTMLSKIPSIVIHTGKFDENDSSMIEECIMSRLGLIPLKKTDNLGSPDNTEYTASINEEGPKTVYSRDIIFSEGIKVVDPDIIILKLKKGEILKFEGFTKEGTGEEHAKYIVCNVCRYKKIDDYFLISIESFGTYTSEEIFIKALDILKENLTFYKNFK
jgi:DNA-directed RNA polymerase alpha subunit